MNDVVLAVLIAVAGMVITIVPTIIITDFINRRYIRKIVKIWRRY